jgi:hypothetical protein
MFTADSASVVGISSASRIFSSNHIQIGFCAEVVIFFGVIVWLLSYPSGGGGRLLGLQLAKFFPFAVVAFDLRL